LRFSYPTCILGTVNNKLARFVAENPTRAIEWPLWLVNLLAGIFILTPFYDNTISEPGQVGGGNAGLAASLNSDSAIIIYAVVVILIGVAGLCGLLIDRPWAQNLRRLAAFFSFITFLYFIILRLLLGGPANLSWTTYLYNAVTSAVIYLRLNWENS